MSRRASRPNAAAATANTWVTRTPSGLPLCRTCHKELGFCSHSPMIMRDRAKSVSRDRSGSIIGQSLVPVLSSSVTSPSAIAANTATAADDQAPQKQEESDGLTNLSGRGTKRHCSGAQGVASGKGKRRGISARRKGKQSKQGKQGKQGRSASIESDDEEEPASDGTPRKSTASAKGNVNPSNNSNNHNNNTMNDNGNNNNDCDNDNDNDNDNDSDNDNDNDNGNGNGNDNDNDNSYNAEDSGGNGGSDDRGSDCAKSDDEGRDAIVGCDALLRFPGFGLNMGGKECLGCYQAENIMINFGCEERRVKEQKKLESAAAAEGGAASGKETNTSADGTVAPASGLDASVSHVMCLDCFRVYVESRVNERKLVTSRNFDGYTVGCPMGCANSCVHPSCFEEVLGAAFMIKYRRFAAIHFASHMKIVWCPGCHCGVLPSAAAAAAAITARQSVPPQVQLPPPPLRRPTNSSWWWGLWAGMGGASAPPPTAGMGTGTGVGTGTSTGTAVGAGTGTGAGTSVAVATAAAERGAGDGVVAAAVEAVPGKSSGNCIGCPGCQASLCMSCKALHEPGVDCDDHARAMVDGHTEAESEGGGGGGGAGGAMRRLLGRSRGGEGQKQGSESTKRCPRCHVPIFKDGGCNHMQCSMCQHEFCWLHLTEWVVGGECQRGHWSSNPVLNRAYNTQRVAGAVQSSCAIS